MPVTETNVGSQVGRLARNVDLAVTRGYGINRQGELLGQVFDASVKGKLLKGLVKLGLAKQGNFLGRKAIALFGRENFAQLQKQMASGGRLQRGLDQNSFRNVLHAFSNLHTEKLDSDLAPQVDSAIRTIFNSIGARGGRNIARKLTDLSATTPEQIISQSRQFLSDSIRSGRATPSIRNASQSALLLATRAIREDMDSNTVAKEAGRIRELSTGGSINRQVQGILGELQSACAGIRKAAQDTAGAETEVEAFRQDFLKVVSDTFEGREATDGARVHYGTRSTPIKDEQGTQPETRRVETTRDGERIRISKQTAFAGEESIRELETVATRLRDDGSETLEAWVSENREAIDNAIEENNNHQLMNALKDLNKATKKATLSHEQRLAAHELKEYGASAFLKDFECTLAWIGPSGSKSHEAIIKELGDAEALPIYQSEQNQALARETLNNGIERAKQKLAGQLNDNPELLAVLAKDKGLIKGGVAPENVQAKDIDVMKLQYGNKSEVSRAFGRDDIVALEFNDATQEIFDAVNALDELDNLKSLRIPD